jgi:hypothetical protein
VTRWQCPRCDREFGAARQSHTCVPGGTVDDTFASHPPAQRAIYDAIIGYLRSLGPVHEDAVTVGVFLKRDRKLAEVRPRSRDVALGIYLPYPVAHPRISRVIRVGGTRVVHQMVLRTVDDVDDEVRGWLAQAFEHASE